MIINTLPKITWRFLKANNTELEELNIEKKKYKDDFFRIENKEFDENFKNIKFGVSEEILRINEENRNFQRNYVVEINQKLNEEHRFEFTKEENEIMDLHNIHLKENSEATILLDFKSEEDVEVIRNSVVKIKAERKSKLKLVLIQRLSKISKNLISVVSNIEEDAEVSFVQVELGSEKSFVSYVANVLGRGAKSYINTAYFVDGQRELDIDYLINHIGRDGFSNMSVNGALKDMCKKRFAGTLDFKKGCIGSDGNEEEYVTLLDKDVRNLAIPLLLAHEHDIQGNHAASAGRIDQDMLYYIMSRGLSEKEAKSIVVESKITPVLDLIDNEKLKEEIKSFVHRGIIQ